MSDALPLPPRPNLEQYKKLARDLQDACKSSDPTAVRQWAARWMDTLVRLHGPENRPAVRRRENEPEAIERRWNRLKENTEPVARCSLSGAQFFIAREHGFANWPRFARHIRELNRNSSAVSAFEAAADAIISGDVPTLRQLLNDHPELVRERSTREHHSTLLHYVSANGVENFRQKTPKNIVEIAGLLLDAGMEVDAESDAYGGGCTALGLVATSVHPEKTGVQIDLLKTLLERGANFEHPSAGGNRHSILHACLANGQPAAAKFLADRGASLDPETAAALDRLDVLQGYFDQRGDRRPETDPKLVESGFLYACGYGSVDAVRFLLDHGVDPATRDDSGQTGLHWASWAPEVEVIRLLLQRGAPVGAKDLRFDATPLDMALWTWNQDKEGESHERCYAAIALLARAGAMLDREHRGDPGEAGSALLRKIDSDPRMLAALRGEF